MMKTPGKIRKLNNFFSLIKHIYKKHTGNTLLKSIYSQLFYLLGKEKKNKDKMSKETIYMSLFVDDMVVCVENLQK